MLGWIALDAAEHEPTMFTASSDARRRATCIFSDKKLWRPNCKRLVWNIWSLLFPLTFRPTLVNFFVLILWSSIDIVVLPGFLVVIPFQKQFSWIHTPQLNYFAPLFQNESLHKPFIWKWVWFAWKWICRENTFSYEWFHFEISESTRKWQILTSSRVTY